MSAAATAVGAKTYLDANIYIFAVEREATFERQVRRLFEAIEADGVEVIASEIMPLELLPEPMRQGRSDAVAAYRTRLIAIGVGFVPVDQASIKAAIELRAAYRLRSMDALHLGTALAHGCDSFITNDRALARVAEPAVLLLDQMTG